MGLRIKVRYLSTETVLEFESRRRDRPVVVGRGERADVRIPLEVLSRRHCLLFEHEGQWLVRDAASRAGTFVNGQKVAVRVQLKPGDVIRLGPEMLGATLTVEGPSAGDLVLGASESEELTLEDCLDDEPERAEVDEPAVEAEAQEEQPFSESDLANAAEQARLRGPRRRRRSWVTVAGSSALTLLVVGLVGYVLYGQRDRINEIGKVKEERVEIRLPALGLGATSQPVTRSEGVILPTTETTAATQTAQASATRPAVVEVAAPVPVPVDPAVEAARREDEWKPVDEAHRLSPPAAALVIYSDYQTAKPNSPLGKELEGYVAEAVDLIWQQRITALCEERTKLTANLARLGADLAAATDSGVRADLGAKKRNVSDRLDRIGAFLRDEVGWIPDAVPDFKKPDELAEARQARDPERYEAFKKRVLTNVQRTRGLLPWQNQ